LRAKQLFILYLTFEPQTERVVNQGTNFMGVAGMIRQISKRSIHLVATDWALKFFVKSNHIVRDENGKSRFLWKSLMPAYNLRTVGKKTDVAENTAQIAFA